MTTTPEILEVRFFGRRAGLLKKTPAGSVFHYLPDYLENPDAIPLSQSLPLQTEAFSPEQSAVTFGNLLPEGEVRRYCETVLRLPPGDDFALLAALGGECAGAISLHPLPAEDTPDPGYRDLNSHELKQLLEEPFVFQPISLEPPGRLRLSLAGAQDKLPVLFRDGKVSLPCNGAPSSHLLKPRNPRFPGLVENELFCLRLARQVGIPAAEAEYLSVGEGALLIRRYDRDQHGDELVRLHQEDCCQALGYPQSRKYQQQGGPGFKELFGLLNRSRQPILERRKLLRLALFNLLIENCDAHGKNFSLLYSGTSFTLAPAYDLVCTTVYGGLDRRLAMAYGGIDQLTLIDRGAIEAFSREAGEPRPRFTLELLAELADTCLEQLPVVQAQVSSCSPHEILPEVTQRIEHRCQVLLKSCG